MNKKASKARKKWWAAQAPDAVAWRMEKARKKIPPGARGDGGHTRWARMTPEERVAHMAKMNKASNKRGATEARAAQLAQARAHIDPEGKKAQGKRMGEFTTSAQKSAHAKQGVAMRHFKRKGYIVEVE